MRPAEILRATTFRWAVAVAAGLMLQTLLVSGFLWWQTAAHGMRLMDRELAEDCEDLRGRSHAGLVHAVGDRVNGDLHRSGYAALFDPEGHRLLGNTASLPAGVRIDGQPYTTALMRSVPLGLYPDRARVVACRAAGGITLLLGRDLDRQIYLRRTIGHAIGLVTFPALLIALAGGLLFSQRAQRRIGRVQTAMERIIGGRLRERLPVFGSADQFDRLSASVNRLLDRTEELTVELRGVGDDLAHELRTPLTRLRAGLERGCEQARTPEQFQEVGARAIREIDQALGMIAALLRLREIEQSRRRSEFMSVDLQRLVFDVADLYAPSAEARGVKIAVDAPARTAVLGDPNLLMEAIANLVDNAVKFTAAGSEVVVSLRRSGEGAVLAVADQGPGIPAADHALMLRRFHRGEAGCIEASGPVPGHGIGLSLVAAIAALHEFRLVFSEAQPGCIASLYCPLLNV